MTSSAASHADLTFEVTAFSATARHNAQVFLRLREEAAQAIAGGGGGGDRGSDILCTAARVSLTTPQQCQLMACALLKVESQTWLQSINICTVLRWPAYQTRPPAVPAYGLCPSEGGC